MIRALVSRDNEIRQMDYRLYIGCKKVLQQRSNSRHTASEGCGLKENTLWLSSSTPLLLVLYAVIM